MYGSTTMPMMTAEEMAGCHCDGEDDLTLREVIFLFGGVAAIAVVGIVSSTVGIVRWRRRHNG